MCPLILSLSRKIFPSGEFKERLKKMYRFRIYYIGSECEVVHEDRVYAYTYGHAVDLAKLNYENNNWTFHYCEIEAERI